MKVRFSQSRAFIKKGKEIRNSSSSSISLFHEFYPEKMLSIARKTALNSNVSRIASRSIVAAKPLIVVPGQKVQRRQYAVNGSASAEKVIIAREIKIIWIESQFCGDDNPETSEKYLSRGNENISLYLTFISRKPSQNFYTTLVLVKKLNNIFVIFHLSNHKSLLLSRSVVLF